MTAILRHGLSQVAHERAGSHSVKLWSSRWPSCISVALRIASRCASITSAAPCITLEAWRVFCIIVKRCSSRGLPLKAELLIVLSLLQSYVSVLEAIELFELIHARCHIRIKLASFKRVLALILSWVGKLLKFLNVWLKLLEQNKTECNQRFGFDVSHILSFLTTVIKQVISKWMIELTSSRCPKRYRSVSVATRGLSQQMTQQTQWVRAQLCRIECEQFAFSQGALSTLLPRCSDDFAWLSTSVQSWQFSAVSSSSSLAARCRARLADWSARLLSFASKCLPLTTESSVYTSW